jgi:hypothetical protein
MNHHKFAVLFWLKKDKINAQGLGPDMGKNYS